MRLAAGFVAIEQILPALVQALASQFAVFVQIAFAPARLAPVAESSREAHLPAEEGQRLLLRGLQAMASLFPLKLAQRHCDELDCTGP